MKANSQVRDAATTSASLRRGYPGVGGKAQPSGMPPKSRGQQGGEGIIMAVKTASGPRKNKIMPLLNGLILSSTDGSSDAPLVPLARLPSRCCRRGHVLPPLVHSLMSSASS